MRSLSLLLLAVCCFVASTVLAGDFETANRLFDEGNFKGARAEYEQLVASGQGSPNIFYNLGNAFYRLGEEGQAILNYERALALDPAHPEANANIALLRSRSGGRVAEPAWWERAILPQASDFFTIAASAAIWSAVALLAWMLIARRASAMLWLVFAVISFVALYAGASTWHLARNRALAIVTAKEADARLAPADRASLAEKLPAGSRVRVLSERGDWTYCELPGRGRGWLPSSALEKVYLPSA